MLSVQFHVSYSHTQGISNSFRVGKGIEALSSFLFQNGQIEKYFQVTSVEVKDFRQDAIVQTMETTLTKSFSICCFFKTIIGV